MYLLDANTYIQAKNFHYQMSFCPAYWSWLDQQFAGSHVASIQFVYDELTDGDDELSIWVKERKAHFISISDDGCQNKFAEIAQYVTDLHGKKPENIADFLARADPWLVAKAAVTGATIVTHEARVPDNCVFRAIVTDRFVLS